MNYDWPNVYMLIMESGMNSKLEIKFQKQLVAS